MKEIKRTPPSAVKGGRERTNGPTPADFGNSLPWSRSATWLCAEGVSGCLSVQPPIRNPTHLVGSHWVIVDNPTGARETI